MKWPRAAIAIAAALLAVRPAAAQPPNGSPERGPTRADAVTCWWQTDTPTIEVGQRFMVVLTCRVLETDTVKAVVDPNQLDPMALVVTPFDVVTGIRHQDVVTSPWRYFQY